MTIIMSAGVSQDRKKIAPLARNLRPIGTVGGTMNAGRVEKSSTREVNWYIPEAQSLSVKSGSSSHTT